MKPQYLRILSLSLEFWGFSRLRIRNLKIVEVFWGRGLCFNFEVFWNLPSKILKLWGEVEGRSFEDEVCIPRLKHCQYFEVFWGFSRNCWKPQTKYTTFIISILSFTKISRGGGIGEVGKGAAARTPPYLCIYVSSPSTAPPNNFFLEIAHTKILVVRCPC